MSTTKSVALCVTCLVDQVMPEVGVATVQLLRRAGYAVAFPPAQTCCGQPFFNSGFWHEARRLARRTIDIFEPYERVLLPGGSCTAMIRVEYPHLLADEPAWAERAQQLAQKSFELSQFLTQMPDTMARLFGTADPTSQTAVTYHDSCHMRRLLHLREEPRRLLRAAGCRLVEMPESDRCCGFGGLFSMRLAEVSNAMTAEKLRQAVETGAELLVTADPGCLMQMRGLAGDGVTLIHLANLLAERVANSQQETINNQR